MKSFHQPKGSFLLSLIAVSVLVSASPLSAQEPSPIPLIPVTQPLAAVPDSTVPPADASSTVSQDAAATEALQIPQEVPLAIPQIQPAATVQPAVAIEPAALAQDPPAPLPQAETALPPINADEMAEEDQDELLRGPVHEAYAEQLNSDPVPGLVIPQKPPEAVEEVAPELKPDGRQVEWISGYWAWDEDQDDFIWVSGIWREVPQGFRWLPGYWTEVEGGYQWVNGTWVSTKTEEITYLNDAPPETLEQGPVGNSPTEQHIWIPGTWTWNETRYAWRPGYWSTGYENWIWVPARYQWTPRGYYHCDGYWDYPVQRRGVLFAPYHFHRRFRPRRIARFTPRVVVASNLLTAHFWVRPRYRHYYFGDYYNVGFANRGLTPWHQFPRQRRCFDPLYAHYGRGRRSNDFYNQLNVQFNVFVNQPNRRPPIRFRDQDRWARDNRLDFRDNDFLGNRFQNVVENASRNRDGFQFVRLENQQREQVQQETRRLRELMDQRRDVERSLAQLERLRNNDGNRGPNDRGSEGRESDGRGQGSNGNDGEVVELRDGLIRDPDRNPKDSGENDVAESDRKDGDRKDRDRDNRGRDGEQPGNSGGDSTDGKVAADGSGDGVPADGDPQDSDRKDGGRRNRDRTRSEEGVANKPEDGNGQSSGNDVGRDAPDRAKGRDDSLPGNGNGDAPKDDAPKGDATRGDAGSGDNKSDPVINIPAESTGTGQGDAGRDNGRKNDSQNPRNERGNDGRPDGGPDGTVIEANKNDDARKGRDRLRLDPPPADGAGTDNPPNRGVIQDQVGKAKEELNDRRDRAEKNVRDAVDRGTPITDGLPAAGDGKRDEPKVDGPKLDLPTRDDVKDQVRIRESRGRDNQPAPGTGTDNSMTIDEKNSNAADRQTELQNRRDRLKLPAAGGAPVTDGDKPADAGSGSGRAVINQTGNDPNPGERNAGAESGRPTREEARERLRLPPAARAGNAANPNANGAPDAGGKPDPASGGTIPDENKLRRSNGQDSIRSPRSRQDASNPASTSNPLERREQNPPTEAPASRNRGTDRSQTRPAPGGNVVNNPIMDATPRNEARSRNNSGSQVSPPLNGGNASGEDRAPRMRLDSNPNRETVKEPAREPAARNIPPQRERPPVGTGANPGSQPGNDRASRREAPPRADSPPAAASRIRGGEPRNIPGNVGNPGGRVGGDSGVAREPRNNPSMGSPRGGDAGGGGRASNAGAGRGNPGAGPASGGAAKGAGGGRREGGGGAAGGAGGAAGGGGGRRGREK